MNFYRLLRELDHQAVGDSLCAIPTGRAYRGANAPYADKIHIFPYAETIRGPSYRHVSEQRNQPNLYMGTAGLMNLGHIARIKPTHAILFDVNPFQTIFWNVVLSAVRYNPVFDAFKTTLNYSEIIARRIVERRLPHVRFSAAGSWTQALDAGDDRSLSRKDFFVSSVCYSSYLDQIGFDEDDYGFLSGMVKENRIGTLTLDMFDVPSWAQLKRRLERESSENPQVPHGADTVYVSSVLRFAAAGTDWTGRALRQTTLCGLSSMLDPRQSLVMDHKGEYRAEEYFAMMKEKKPCLYQTPQPKAYAPEHGAGRSALRFG